MNKAIINHKIEIVKNCVSSIVSKIPDSDDTLIRDFALQDLISINLERAVAVSVEIATEIVDELEVSEEDNKESAFKVLAGNRIITYDVAESLDAAVGFSDISKYRYSAIDWKRVYTFVTTKLDVFDSFVGQVGRYVGVDK